MDASWSQMLGVIGRIEALAETSRQLVRVQRGDGYKQQRSPTTKQEMDQMRSMLEAGHSQLAVAKAVGRNQATVQKFRLRYGWPLNRQPPRRTAASHYMYNRPECIARFMAGMADLAAGISPIEIASKYRVEPSTVYRWRSGKQWKHLPRNENVLNFTDASITAKT